MVIDTIPVNLGQDYDMSKGKDSIGTTLVDSTRCYNSKIPDIPTAWHANAMMQLHMQGVERPDITQKACSGPHLYCFTLRAS